jgi:hypothetical protein
MKPKLMDPPPPEILELQREFDVWRSAHPRRTPFPDSLWAAAAKVAAQHGIYRTAKLLRLDSSALKRRMPGAAPMPSPPAFVELITPNGPPSECVIEIEQPLQGKVRLELKGWRPADVSDVVRRLWSRCE